MTDVIESAMMKLIQDQILSEAVEEANEVITQSLAERVVVKRMIKGVSKSLIMEVI